MNEIPKWAKKCLENFRVEVHEYSSYKKSRDSERECEKLADELNDLFSTHKHFDDYKAEVNSDEVIRCIFCDEIYIPDCDEEGQEHCRSCGKGKLEYAIKRMAESDGVKTNDSILQK